MILLFPDNGNFNEFNNRGQINCLSPPDTSSYKTITKDITVLYTNADQFLNKINDLEMLIAGSEPDLMLITEILPKNHLYPINKASLMIPGYLLYLNFDPDSDITPTLDIRGVGIFISNTLSATQVHFNNNSYKDHVWIRLDLQGQDKLLVGCIYRSPSAAMVISISPLCSLLEELNDFTHLLIYGDFNIKDINWSNMSVNPRNAHVESFIDTIQDLFLFQHIQEPTRFRPGTTPSLLDLVFTNEANIINHIDYLPGLGNSDHVCIYFHLSCYSTFKPNHTPRYNVYRADFDSMHAAFSTIDWPDIMEPMNTKETWEFFKTVLQDIIDKYVPISIGVQKKRNIYMSPEAFRIKN